MLSSSNARLAAARRLTRRSARRAAGRFLAEGPQAVREARVAGAVIELFATADAMLRHPELCADADEITAKDAAALSETVTPQGVVAVCRAEAVLCSGADADSALASILADSASSAALLAVLVEPNDPGNLGTVIRTADAAGAGAVVVCGGVDPLNGKCVRASAGSVFHLPVVETTATDLLSWASRHGVMTLAATGGVAGDGTPPEDLSDLEAHGLLAGSTAWLFGSEAHGLPAPVIDAADRAVRVPIHGRAESLNLAAAAAVCLYASARAHHPIS